MPSPEATAKSLEQIPPGSLMGRTSPAGDRVSQLRSEQEPLLPIGQRQATEVIRLLALGYAPARIAEATGVSEKKLHSIMAKPERVQEFHDWLARPADAVQPELVRLLPYAVQALEKLMRNGSRYDFERSRLSAIQLLFQALRLIEQDRGGGGAAAQAVTKFTVNYVTSAEKIPPDHPVVVETTAKELSCGRDASQN